uniref:Uncharacterized protein n=1 Tax=Pristionchus pacificus TaxID=54126 RepID=A0A2A6D1H8_PRIPA|eukprot:PDM84342.1 hypothetical protein PRIPAC_33365 [Pristionchus pacificus]
MYLRSVNGLVEALLRRVGVRCGSEGQHEVAGERLLKPKASMNKDKYTRKSIEIDTQSVAKRARFTRRGNRPQSACAV